MLLHLVPAGRARLLWDILRTEAPFHIPENIIIDEIDSLARALNEDRFALLTAIQEQIAGDAVVLIAHIHPQMIGTERFCKDIAPDQAVHTVVHFDAARFPGKLHSLPAGSRNSVVLNQHVGGKQSGNAADARVPDLTAAHHRMADDLVFLDGVVPALVADIDAHSVGPVDHTVLDHPMMAAEARDAAALRHRRAGGRMGADKSLHLDVGEERCFGREALFPAGQFDHMILRIPIVRKTEMHRLPVGFHPVGAGGLRHLIVKSHLAQRLSVTEHHAAAVQVRRHIRFVVFNKQAVMQDIDCAEGIVPFKFLRIQPGLFDHSLPVSECCIADHAVRSLTAAPGTDTFPIYAAVDPDAFSRAGAIRRGLDCPQRMIGAAVVFV